MSAAHHHEAVINEEKELMAGRQRMSAGDRFMSHVEKREDGCWVWVAARYSNGYGKFKLPNGKPGGQAILAHRFAYIANVGPISGVINHLCENKACVNPSHLADVSQRENVRYSLSSTCKRGHSLQAAEVYVSPGGKRSCRECRRERAAETNPIDRSNAAKTHCKNGHPLFGDNVYVRPGTNKRNCRTCQREINFRAWRKRRDTQRAGDIGRPIRHIELEPLEAPSRREAPAAPVPAPQPESVPA